MLYPLPAVLVTVRNKKGENNVLTIAWAGTVCTNPPMVSISVRPERYSYPMLAETGEFVINLATEQMTYAVDYCGVKSGKDIDKFRELKLETEDASHVSCYLLKDSPVNIECQVTKVEELGSHHMFIAQVVAVHVDERYMNGQKFQLADAAPIVYSHGEYYGLGDLIGSFGYSVRKK